MLLEKDELDVLKLESKETIDPVQFVDHCEIDPRFFEKPYFVTPGDGKVAEEGFAVIRDALAKSNKVGLGQLAARGISAAPSSFRTGLPGPAEANGMTVLS